jgi:hypothetical protein
MQCPQVGQDTNIKNAMFLKCPVVACGSREKGIFHKERDVTTRNCFLKRRMTIIQQTDNSSLRSFSAYLHN